MNIRNFLAITLGVAGLFLVSGCGKSTTVVNQEQGKMCFDVQPQNARIEIDGSFRATAVSGCMDVRPGRHRVVITADGYMPFEGIVNVASGQRRTVTARLEPVSSNVPRPPTRPAPPQPPAKPAPPPQARPAPSQPLPPPAPRTGVCLNIQPASADVEINGNYMGRANKDCIDLKPGTYHVRVSKPNFQPYQQTVVVAPGKQVLVSTRLMKDEKPKERPEAKPNRPDSKERPVKNESPAPPGKAKKPQPPAVTPTPAPAPTPEPAPAKARICFDVKPSSADVEIDGELVEKAEKECVEAGPGKHKIRVLKENFADFEREVNLKAGETETISVRLEKDDRKK